VTPPDSAEATADPPVDPVRVSDADDGVVTTDATATTAADIGAPAGPGAPAEDPAVVPPDAARAPAVSDETPAESPDGHGADEAPAESPDAQWADEHRRATALTWVDAASVSGALVLPGLDAADGAAPERSLLAGARLRPAIARPGVLVPLGVLVALAGAYAGTTLLWPLHEVAPTVESVEVSTVPAAAAAIAWPGQGSAAVGVGGLATAASTTDQSVIASVTKVVSSLMVLDRMPLAPGEQGPEFSFTYADSVDYWSYRRSDQSALDVPVGGTLTEYQMLQGVLLGSANNYIDRLAKEIWGSNGAFAEAAEEWLRDRGLEGITIKTPSGFDDRNVATPAALVALAERAMQNPVFAEIVGTASVDLPGAGTVVNTNGMLADTGVVGVKTGTLGESWNLLTAKDVDVDGTTVHLYASVLGQADDDMRLAATRSLFEQVEAELRAQQPVVPRGTVVGTVDTAWGATAEIVTGADARVVLWNSATATATTDIALGEDRDKGDEVGTLTATGPLDASTTPLTLAQDVEGPSAWWRLTHPLELFGLADSSR